LIDICNKVQHHEAELVFWLKNFRGEGFQNRELKVKFSCLYWDTSVHITWKALV